jgi:hypothetical protein
MKKYFLFDDEPISGWSYLLRFIVGGVLTMLLVGIWITSSAAYKRSGTFGWSNELRIFCAIVIPIVALTNILYNELDSLGPVIDFLTFGFGIIHLILFFKNGNKTNLV